MKPTYHFFIAICSLVLIALQQVNASNKLHMIVGTYTDNSDSRGIYLFSFNQRTGEALLRSSTPIGNPSFVTYSASRRTVYSVSEFSNTRAAANATPLNLATAQWGTTVSTNASSQGTGAEDPCNIWTNGNYVVTSNYTGGSLSVFGITHQGQELTLRQFIPIPSADGTSQSHIHCALPTPDNRYLLVADLGNNCIYRFTIHHDALPESNAPLLTNRITIYQGLKGSGPRHFTFSSDGHWLYLINELGGNVIVFRYYDGQLTQTASHPAEEVEAHGSADIHLSPDGRFLYTSHRLQNDGICIFERNASDGSLRKIGYQPTARHPRNFAITPNGKYLLVASRDDNCIEVYRRNSRTGLLQPTSQNIKLPKPVCIQFE